MLVRSNPGIQPARTIQAGQSRRRSANPARNAPVTRVAANRISPATPPTRYADTSASWNSQCRSIQGRPIEPNVNGSTRGMAWCSRIQVPARRCHQISESNNSWQPRRKVRPASPIVKSLSVNCRTRMDVMCFPQDQVRGDPKKANLCKRVSQKPGSLSDVPTTLIERDPVPKLAGIISPGRIRSLTNPPVDSPNQVTSLVSLKNVFQFPTPAGTSWLRQTEKT